MTQTRQIRQAFSVFLSEEELVPEISRFFGIVIGMFYNDHAPPHFHARYAGYEAKVAIHSLSLVSGYLPPRVLGLVVEWATQHRKELEENWLLARSDQPLRPIAPLE